MPEETSGSEQKAKGKGIAQVFGDKSSATVEIHEAPKHRNKFQFDLKTASGLSIYIGICSILFVITNGVLIYNYMIAVTPTVVANVTVTRVTATSGASQVSSTRTPTPTPTRKPTLTATNTPTNVSGTDTPTSTPTPTRKPTLTATNTPTNVPGTGTSTPTATCPEDDSSKYGFELELADVPWVVQTYIGSQAITEVAQSGEMARFGCYSLKATVDLVGGHENKSNGETFVDLSFFPPTGVQAPVNLEGVPITVSVYVPRDAAGDSGRPNGIQVFVKDKNFASEYGAWFDLSDSTDRWVSISLVPMRETPPSGFMENGFDPSNIVIVGIKIGVGSDSIATYRGPIYIDGINW